MTVLITGANRGIGAALYAAYSAGGRKVLGTARAPSDTLIPLDVTEPASLQALSEDLAGTPLSLLICNAGVYVDKHFDLDRGYPAEAWSTTFATNVTGVFHTIQTCLPNLRAASGAKIAIISSQMASSTRAPGGSYIYRASKAAALNLGVNLAKDLAPEGISVGIYHPGWVQTDMGGTQADITPEQAATGLIARFDALSLETTGCFETWDGRPHPF